MTTESSIVRFVISDSEPRIVSTLGGVFALNLALVDEVLTIYTAWSENLIRQWRKRQERVSTQPNGNGKFKLELPYTFTAPQNQCFVITSKELRPDNHVFIATGSNGDKFHLYYIGGSAFQRWVDSDGPAVQNERFNVVPGQETVFDLSTPSDSLRISLVLTQERVLKVTACWGH